MASDYDLVLANFKMKLKVECCPKSIRIRFHLDNQKLSRVFQTQIGGKFAALDLIDREIDTIANDIKVELLQLKRYWEETEKIQIWIKNETLDVCDEKRELKG